MRLDHRGRKEAIHRIWFRLAEERFGRQVTFEPSPASAEA